MTQIETSFNDLGINAIKGVELLEYFGLSTYELEIPSVFSKLQSVIKYLGQFPEDTQRFLINKATRGKLVDKLGHMYEYTQILREKEQQEKELEGIDKELSALGVTDDYGRLTELQFKKEDTNTNLNRLKEELDSFI